MANLFRCGGGANSGGGSVNIEDIISEAGISSDSGTTTATKTFNFTAPSKGILIVYYERWRESNTGVLKGSHTISRNATQITASTSITTPTILECEEGDDIIMKSTAYLQSTTSGGNASGTKRAYLSYTFIPT